MQVSGTYLSESLEMKPGIMEAEWFFAASGDYQTGHEVKSLKLCAYSSKWCALVRSLS